MINRCPYMYVIQTWITIRHGCAKTIDWIDRIPTPAWSSLQGKSWQQLWLLDLIMQIHHCRSSSGEGGLGELGDLNDQRDLGNLPDWSSCDVGQSWARKNSSQTMEAVVGAAASSFWRPAALTEVSSTNGGFGLSGSHGCDGLPDSTTLSKI